MDDRTGVPAGMELDVVLASAVDDPAIVWLVHTWNDDRFDIPAGPRFGGDIAD